MSALILNVNDHVANLYMVSKMLAAAGFRVSEARTGTDAIDVAIEQHPDVIVLDVHLPDLDGYEVCRRLKANPLTKDIKIVHTSAQIATASARLEGEVAGADGYLAQPFEPEELISTVRSLGRLHATESDLVARNEALELANRRKDEYVAMLAHELRNPLAALAMVAPLLDRHPARDAVEAQARIVMRRQTALLSRLVDDLLDVSRVTRGRIELRCESLELAAFVHRVCDEMRPRVFDPRGQTLVLDASTPLIVSGDPGRLEQVLCNLLENASKYSEPGTRVDVTVHAAGEHAEIVVRDRGIGIDAAILPRIFELFVQSERTFDHANGGLGIGLTLVKSLVELHGGTVTAASPGVGRGTTMTVRLPVQPADAKHPPAVEPRRAPDRARILLVDDNEDGRELMSCLCELRGHEVVQAEDGLGGVAAALRTRPDVAIVDIGLPGIDGFEVARRIRAELGGGIRLVALSGFSSERDRERASAAGFDLHVAKPIDAAQLEDVLARMLVRPS